MGAKPLLRVLASTGSLPCRRVLPAAKLWRSRAYRARLALERFQERRYVRMQRDPDFVIELVFGSYASQAKRVAACESGDTDGDLSPHVVWAHNGQYLGMFQMGSSERGIYGHGDTPLEQARAAYRYFVASGRDWSPWSCKPW